MLPEALPEALPAVLDVLDVLEEPLEELESLLFAGLLFFLLEGPE